MPMSSGACLFGGDWMSTNGDERGLQLLELTPWKRGRGNRAKRNSFASGGGWPWWWVGFQFQLDDDPVVRIIPPFISAME